MALTALSNRAHCTVTFRQSRAASVAPHPSSRTAALRGNTRRLARDAAAATPTPRSRGPLARAAAVHDAVPASNNGAPAASKLPKLPALDGSYEAQAAFGPAASWLLPGALLVGRYPYASPPSGSAHEVTTHDEGEALLEEIVSRGPHVFVSLQAEVPPQGEMRIGGAGGFLPYKPVVELMAAAHTPPPPGAVVNGVRNPTLDKFLPQRRRAAAPEVVAYYEAERVAFLHWPLPAGGAAPPPGLLDAAVAELSARLGRGERVYIHGHGGGGRGVVVGACLLVALYGLSADEALQRVQRSADTRCDGGDGSSPETEEQRAAVKDFAARWARGGRA